MAAPWWTVSAPRSLSRSRGSTRSIGELDLADRLQEAPFGVFGQKDAQDLAGWVFQRGLDGVEAEQPDGAILVVCVAAGVLSSASLGVGRPPVGEMKSRSSASYRATAC